MRSGPPAGRLILFNKPHLVLCQFSAQPGRLTLADYVPIPDVYPAGRLDHDSEGLLLLTNDGPFIHRITDPRHKLPKTYWIQVEGVVGEDALRRLRTGVFLNDGPTLPAQATLMAEPAVWPRVPPIRERRHIPTSWISLTITEGRNRQVRRMTAAVGHPTLRLIRYSVGQWTLEGLRPGQWVEVRQGWAT